MFSVSFRFVRFWRVRAITTGLSLDSSAIFQASLVSFPSAGLNVIAFGIDLIIANCSIGWWVGPSSPTATES